MDQGFPYFASLEVCFMSSINISNFVRRRRRRTFLWLVGSTVTVCALLYWEQSAVLYVLATLAMCGFLLVVAFSNLEAKDRELKQLNDDQRLPNFIQTDDEHSAEERAA